MPEPALGHSENSGDSNLGSEMLLESTWPLAPWLPIVILLAAALLLSWLYLTERGALQRPQRILLAGLRWLAVLTIVVMLYGWTIARYRTNLPDLVLAIDFSASMTLEDQYPPAQQARLLERVDAALPGSVENQPSATRLKVAQAILLENQARFLTQIKQGYQVRFFSIGNVARPIDDAPAIADSVVAIEARDESSRLGSCLRMIMDFQRGRPTAAIVLFTDGVTTDGPSLLEGSQLLRHKGIPLFIVGLGSAEPQRDLQIADLLVDEAAFVDDLVNFDARVVAAGFEGETTIRLKDVDSQQTLAETKVRLSGEATQEPVRLAWRPEKKGDYHVAIEVDPAEGEINLENNRRSRTIRVDDPKLKVLLVQSGPSFEFRFLKSMLERELNREPSAKKEERGFHAVLQEADKEYVDTDKSAIRHFPATREELFTYDVLIFGDVNPEFLSRTALENVAAFVTERGGGLVVYAGPRYTPLAYRDSPLAALFPLRLDAAFIPESAASFQESYRPRITPLGAAFPGMQLADSPAANVAYWEQELSPLYWYLAAPELRPGVRVLAEHPTRTGSSGQPLPIIGQQYVGAGQVIFHATDETHRWRSGNGERHFARYWVQTIRALARSRLDGGQGVELTTDKTEYRQGESVHVRVRFLDEHLAPPQDNGVTLLAERPGMQRRSLELQRAGSRGVFEGALTSLPEGEFRIWLAAPALEGPPAEKRFTIAAPPGEFARLEADVAAMREAAKISGGRYYSIDDAERVPAELPKGSQVRIEALPPQSIWNSPFVAAWLVLLLTAEWTLRKRWGLA